MTQPIAGLDPPTLGELARTLARIERSLEQMDRRLDQEFSDLPRKFVTREVYELAHGDLRRELMSYADAKATQADVTGRDVATQLDRIRKFAYWSAGGVLLLLASGMGYLIQHLVVK